MSNFLFTVRLNAIDNHYVVRQFLSLRFLLLYHRVQQIVVSYELFDDVLHESRRQKKRFLFKRGKNLFVLVRYLLEVQIL